jgi:CBS-domain-containing membrane protein
MRRHVQTVVPTASVREAAQRLIGHRINALCVVGPSGKLLGIVSIKDVLQLQLGDTWFEQIASSKTLSMGPPPSSRDHATGSADGRPRSTAD